MEQATDVIVIGAGISGCASAYNLAKRGLRVVVLEKDHIAFEASGRTMAAISLLGKHGPDDFRLARSSMDLWEGLSDELGTDVEYIKGGRLAIADSDADLPLFQAMVEGAEESGVHIERFEAKEARVRWPFLEGPFLGAAFSPHEGYANPPKTVHAFARVAREYGASFHTGCSVTNIGVTAGRVSSVSTSLGEIKTDAVISAAGVWASRLADRVGVHIPVQLLRAVQGETSPGPRLFDSFIRGPDYGARQTASGTFRIGGGYRRVDVYHDLSLHGFRDMRVWLPRFLMHRRDMTMQLDGAILRHDFTARMEKVLWQRAGEPAPVGLEPRRHPRNIRRKLARFGRLIPKMQGLTFTDTWTGFIDVTPDLLPVLGPVNRPKGLYLAMGFSGHGFALGPIVGRLMADLVIDGKTSLSIHSFRPGRFTEGDVRMPGRML